MKTKKSKNDAGARTKPGNKVKGAASGNCYHHLLLSWGNSHHRRKILYIGGLIYGYCLYCCKLFFDGNCIPNSTEKFPEFNEKGLIALKNLPFHKI